MSSGNRMAVIYRQYKAGLKEANKKVYKTIKLAQFMNHPMAEKVAKKKLRKNTGRSRKLARKMIRESLRSIRMKEIKGLCKTGSPSHWGHGKRW